MSPETSPTQKTQWPHKLRTGCYFCALSSLKNIEKGEIRSFDSLLRVLRTLGKLDVLQPLVEEEQMSPSEYYAMVHAAGAGLRKRAVGKLDKGHKEEAGW